MADIYIAVFRDRSSTRDNFAKRKHRERIRSVKREGKFTQNLHGSKLVLPEQTGFVTR